jgi:hypothetical protein
MKHIERTFDGENQWWKYLVVIIFGFIGAQALGMIPAISLATSALDENSTYSFSEIITDFTLVGYSKNINLILLLIPFVITLFFSIKLIEVLHKRSFSEITNGNKKLRWNRVWFSFIIWFVISLIATIISYFLDPGNFSFQFDISTFAFLVLISVVLIPLQTTAEEFYFRGYFYQVIGIITKSRLAAALIPGVLFGLMHVANPEVQEYGFWLAMPHYIIAGVVLGIITAVDDGMELAIGTHAANNMFLSIFVTEKSAVFQTDALMVANELPLDFLALIITIIINAIFIYVLHRKYKFNWKNLTAKIEKPATN